MSTNKSYRIRTKVGEDRLLTLNLDQEYDQYDILTLRLTQENLYPNQCADFGVVVGRVFANGGVGLPNAKVSIFIPIDEVDQNNPLVREKYPFTSVDDRRDGVRYNLLPSKKQSTIHTPVGTFPTKEDILQDDTWLYVYEKYYKFTTRTNSAGDFMFYGVPTGTYKLHLDLDLSDLGDMSVMPFEMMAQGFTKEKFDGPNRFKFSKELDNLPQIISANKTITVFPFWGEKEKCNVQVVRSDFDLTSRYEFQSFAIFMGGSFTDSKRNFVTQYSRIKKKQGEEEQLIARGGTIDIIHMVDRDGDNVVDTAEELTLSEAVIDEDGTWAFLIPLHGQKVITDEFGVEVPSPDGSVGMAKDGHFRFKFQLNGTNTKGGGRKTKEIGPSKYIVPNNGANEFAYLFDTESKYYQDVNGTDIRIMGINDVRNELPSVIGVTPQQPGGSLFTTFLRKKIYTVRNYIPRIQNKKSTYAFGDFLGSESNTSPLNEMNRTYGLGRRYQKYLGLKNVGKSQRNPIPYNRYDPTTTAFFLIQCLLLNIILFMAALLNKTVLWFINTFISPIIVIICVLIKLILFVINMIIKALLLPFIAIFIIVMKALKIIANGQQDDIYDCKICKLENFIFDPAVCLININMNCNGKVPYIGFTCCNCDGENCNCFIPWYDCNKKEERCEQRYQRCKENKYDKCVKHCKTHAIATTQPVNEVDSNMNISAANANPLDLSCCEPDNPSYPCNDPCSQSDMSNTDINPATGDAGEMDEGQAHCGYCVKYQSNNPTVIINGESVQLDCDHDANHNAGVWSVNTIAGFACGGVDVENVSNAFNCDYMNESTVGGKYIDYNDRNRISFCWDALVQCKLNELACRMDDFRYEFYNDWLIGSLYFPQVKIKRKNRGDGTLKKVKFSDVDCAGGSATGGPLYTAIRPFKNKCRDLQIAERFEWGQFGNVNFNAAAPDLQSAYDNLGPGFTTNYGPYHDVQMWSKGDDRNRLDTGLLKEYPRLSEQLGGGMAYTPISSTDVYYAARAVSVPEGGHLDTSNNTQRVNSFDYATNHHPSNSAFLGRNSHLLFATGTVTLGSYLRQDPDLYPYNWDYVETTTYKDLENPIEQLCYTCSQVRPRNPWLFSKICEWMVDIYDPEDLLEEKYFFNGTFMADNSPYPLYITEGGDTGRTSVQLTFVNRDRTDAVVNTTYGVNPFLPLAQYTYLNYVQAAEEADYLFDNNTGPILGVDPFYTNYVPKLNPSMLYNPDFYTYNDWYNRARASSLYMYFGLIVGSSAVDKVSMKFLPKTDCDE